MSPEERRIDGESRERLTVLLDGLEGERAAAAADREAAALDREENEKTRNVLLRASGRMGLLQWVTLALGFFSIALGVTLALTLVHLHSQGAQRSREQIENIARNTKSIEVGCALLKDIASQAGVIGTGSDVSEATKVQKGLVALVFDVAIRGMTKAERARFDALYKRFLKAGPYVRLPDCKQVAQHPETVLQKGKTTKQEKPQP